MTKNKLEMKFEIHNVSEDKGTFEGYASTFRYLPNKNVVMNEHCLDEFIKDNEKVPLLWQHEWDEPIGIVTNFYKDDKGMKFNAELCLEVGKAREAYALMKQGALKETSIGFFIIEEKHNTDFNCREFTEIRPHELSVVTFAADPEAAIQKVHTDSSIREIETALRDAGFSRSEAKIGAKAHQFLLSNQRDADDTNGQELDEFLAEFTKTDTSDAPSDLDAILSNFVNHKGV